MTSSDKYNLEKIYDDLLVAEADNLFQKNAIIDVSRPEKYLFVFVINDGQDWETEIFKPFTKVQKSTCSCSFHQHHAVCKHVIAGLFYLRAQKNKTQKKKQESSKPKPKALNTHTLLQHVEREELIHFVRDYARRDARFALQLKIHFARHVDLPNNREKYAQILNAIIKPHTGKTKPSQNEVKGFLKVTEDLIDQMEDSLALEQYEEAFHMLQAGYYKFCYVFHYYGQEMPSFTQQNMRWIQAIDSFLHEKIPYGLKKEMKDFLLDLSFFSFYRHHDINHNIAMVLKNHLGALERKNFLARLAVHAEQQEGQEKTTILALWAYLSEELTPALRQTLEHPGFPILSFFKQISQLEAWNLCRQVIEFLDKRPGTPAELYLWQTENLIRLRAFPEALDLALNYYTRTGQIQAIQKIKEAVDIAYWENTIKSKVEKKVLQDQNPFAIAAYLHWNQNWDSLYHFLMTQEDIVPYLKFLPDMSKHRPDESEDLITQHLTHYLQNHLGEKSQQDLQHFFRNMDNAKLFALRKKVALNLAKSFQERQALVQWLNALS